MGKGSPSAAPMLALQRAAKSKALLKIKLLCWVLEIVFLRKHHYTPKFVLGKSMAKCPSCIGTHCQHAGNMRRIQAIFYYVVTYVTKSMIKVDPLIFSDLQECELK